MASNGNEPLRTEDEPLELNCPLQLLVRSLVACCLLRKRTAAASVNWLKIAEWSGVAATRPTGWGRVLAAPGWLETPSCNFCLLLKIAEGSGVAASRPTGWGRLSAAPGWLETPSCSFCLMSLCLGIWANRLWTVCRLYTVAQSVPVVGAWPLRIEKTSLR